jgi:hypothetical protein
MTNDQREVLFQSQKEDKAAELVDYAKTLYSLQDEALKRRFPLAKPLKEQASLKLGIRKRKPNRHPRRCRPDPASSVSSCPLLIDRRGRPMRWVGRLKPRV